jgi:hypothetical protein
MVWKRWSIIKEIFPFKFSQEIGIWALELWYATQRVLSPHQVALHGLIYFNFWNGKLLTQIQSSSKWTISKLPPFSWGLFHFHKRGGPWGSNSYWFLILFFGCGLRLLVLLRPKWHGVQCVHMECGYERSKPNILVLNITLLELWCPRSLG